MTHVLLLPLMSIFSWRHWFRQPSTKRQRLRLFFFFFNNCIVPLGFLPWEIRVAFPEESQLLPSRATQPTGHIGWFSVSIIHRTLTWTTGSLTCVQMLMRTRVCTERWLGEKSHAAPVSAVCRSDASLSELHPHPYFDFQTSNWPKVHWKTAVSVVFSSSSLLIFLKIFISFLSIGPVVVLFVYPLKYTKINRLLFYMLSYS